MVKQINYSNKEKIQIITIKKLTSKMNKYIEDISGRKCKKLKARILKNGYFK